mmetsp:Transcript_30372/g.98767  ORF Transcript_30372/g.98767 Transcript_30372/m.98767 type:complete len:253 (+) Transcript_30372:929-1687(+)
MKIKQHQIMESSHHRCHMEQRVLFCPGLWRQEIHNSVVDCEGDGGRRSRLQQSRQKSFVEAEDAFFGEDESSAFERALAVRGGDGGAVARVARNARDLDPLLDDVERVHRRARRRPCEEPARKVDAPCGHLPLPQHTLCESFAHGKGGELHACAGDDFAEGGGHARVEPSDPALLDDCGARLEEGTVRARLALRRHHRPQKIERVRRRRRRGSRSRAERKRHRRVLHVQPSRLRHARERPERTKLDRCVRHP